MADNAIVLLDALLAERDRLRGGERLPDDAAFELFAFEQCLKEEDLSEDEIANGQVGGGDDGGVNGLYCFLNENLLEEDAEVLEDGFDAATVKREPDLTLVLIQAKRTASFGETAFEKLAATLREFLDLAKSEELSDLFSPAVIARFGIFRTAWQKLATRHPKIRVVVYYATKGDTGDVNEKVHARAQRLIEQIEADVPKATVSVELLGARELVDLAGQEKAYTLELAFQEGATARDSHVALVSLDDYYAFISDNGTLRKHIFDWNVRDYEGAVEVNREIVASLASPVLGAPDRRRAGAQRPREGTPHRARRRPLAAPRPTGSAPPAYMLGAGVGLAVAAKADSRELWRPSAGHAGSLGG